MSAKSGLLELLAGVVRRGSSKTGLLIPQVLLIIQVLFFYHANAASESAIAAKNSAAAVAQVYDNFADTYLGSMADGATASVVLPMVPGP